MGVLLYPLGAHRAHEEILNRINLNAEPDARSHIYFFNEQAYGQYEEQMTSCKKIFSNETNRQGFFKLIPGKRKEAMDAEKNALHASYAIGIRTYTSDMFRQIEKYLYG